MKRERILPWALILLAWFSIPHASADGGFFPTSREIAVSTGQRAIITKNGNDLSITLSTGYTGEGGDFCWIIPTPVTPAIDKVVEAGNAGEDAFKILDEVTAPEIYTRKSGGCFPSGTEVLTTSGPCAIEKVGPGTTIFACDLATGVWVEAAVLRTLSQQYDGDMISIQMGAITLRATGNHPFYVLEGDRVASRRWPQDVPEEAPDTIGQGRWVEARDLQAGDLLMARAGGGLKVTGVSSRHEKAFVYNLSIEGYHNYAVCLSGILVHNKAGKETEPGAQGLVTVYGRATLEHYEVSILGASGASALLMWLQGNGYRVNPAARKVLDAYLHEGWSFVAVKLNPAEKRHYEDEFLPPLTIKYRSDHFVFPLRISSVSTVQTARITLYVIAESTVSASNLTTKMLAFEKNLPAGADPEEYIEACVQKTTGGERGRELAVLWSGQLPARVDGKVLDRMMSTPFAEGMPRYLTRLEARMDPAVMTEDIKLSLDQKPKGFVVMLAGQGYGAGDDPAGIALVEAVRAGNTEKVQILLAAGADVRGSYGGNALNAAAGGGRNEIVNLLLSAGAEVRGPSGVTALNAAAQKGHANTIKILLAAGADAEGTPSPLTSASGGGYLEIVQLLLAAGANAKRTPEALTAAAQGDATDIVRLLLGAGADAKGTPEALTTAAGEGHTETVQLLLGAGTPVDSKTRFIHIMTNLPHSWSALMYAISNGNQSTVKALLNAGADVNSSDEQGMTPIILAAMQWRGDHVVDLQLLLDAGAEVNARKKDGLTALMIASGAGDAEGVQMLLLAGADVNARRDSDGLNALILASLGGFTEIVKLLIAGGADLEARDMRGRTALMAASEGDIEPFYAEDMEGLPNGGHALIFRAQREAMAAHTEAVRVLLDLGADVNAKDNQGWTSLRYAVDRAEIARVLIEAGAKE